LAAFCSDPPGPAARAPSGPTMQRLTRIARHVAAGATGPPAPLAPCPNDAGSPIMDTLKGKMAALIKEKLAQKAELLKTHSDTAIQSLTVEMAINGGRSAKMMVTETSDLDALEGIAYRGRSLYECNKVLPKAPGGDSGLPEAAFWLLLTGEVPSESECRAFTAELHRRSAVPQHVLETLGALPRDTHPMTQLSICVLACQRESVFTAKYNAGMRKAEYWEWALEDAVDLAARIPVVAAHIYRRTFADGVVPAYNSELDWAANYASMLGVTDDAMFREVMRLYLMVHADHEGGNVSAHTTHLVGSALSDPYYAWGAGLCGLAGPLHGLANQECLAWLLEVQRDLGGQPPTPELIAAYVEKTLASGKVIPGFGHAVLRKTDPRYMLEREFALKHCKSDPLFQLVDSCYQAIPQVLAKTGKVKNPFPNVDAHSGQLMFFYGLREQNYYTVIFAVSRCLGCMAQLVWARALGLPLERPKSLPLDELERLTKK